MTLTLPDADAGTAIAYSYTSSRVPKRTKLVIQRQIGTARKFKTVATLARNSSGSGQLPALDLGLYKLRIAVRQSTRAKHRSHTAIIAQQRRTLRVFASLPFSVLFKQTEQTFTTPTHSFSYIFTRHYVTDSQTMITVDKAKNRCRSVHIDWVAEVFDGGDLSETGMTSLIQESRDRATSTAASETISGLDSSVSPGQSWGINVASMGSNALNFYVNGSASCYSRSLV